MERSKLSAPCKDCEDRHEGCHAECERYKVYKNEREAAKKWLKEQSDADGVGCERGIRLRERMRRKKGGLNK